MKLGLIFVGLMVLAVGLALQPLLAKGGKGKNTKTLAFLGILIVVASGGVYYLVGSPVLVNSPKFLEGLTKAVAGHPSPGKNPFSPHSRKSLISKKPLLPKTLTMWGGGPD